MVNYQPVLDKTFAALADPTRRAILTRLAQGPATAGELAKPFEISLPAVSRHLKVLERAGLLERQRRGREHHCRLNTRPLQEAAVWIDTYTDYWEGQLDQLARFLKSED